MKFNILPISQIKLLLPVNFRFLGDRLTYDFRAVLRGGQSVVLPYEVGILISEALEKQ